MTSLYEATASDFPSGEYDSPVTGGGASEANVAASSAAALRASSRLVEGSAASTFAPSSIQRLKISI